MIKVDFIYSGVSIHSNNNTTVSAFKQQDALHHCTYSNGKIERTFSWSHTGKRQLQNLQSPVEHTMCDEKGKEKERRRCT